MTDKNLLKIDIVLGVGFYILLLLMKIKFKDNGNKFVIFLKKNFTKIIIFIIFTLSTVNIIYNTLKNMQIIKSNASGNEQGWYAEYVNVYEKLVNNLQEYDKSLYRTESTFLNEDNEPINHGYYGISYSSSTYSKKTHEFLRKFGIRQDHVFVEYDMECTKTVDMLLGIKYYLMQPDETMRKEYPVEYEDEYIDKTTTIRKNPYALSLGYEVNSNITNTNMDTTNTFELQNELLKNMTGMEENVYTKHEGEIKETAVEKVEKAENGYKMEEAGGKFTYEFTIEQDGNAYIYIISRGNRGFFTKINDEEYKVHGAYSGNEMINIGKRKKGDKITLEFTIYDDMAINEVYLYYEDEEILQKYYTKLSEKQAEIIQIDNRTYQMNVNIENGGDYLLLTIPYEDGWKIEVDGKKVESEELIGALIGVKLESGEHEITIQYTTPGIYLGAICSVIGIILLIIIVLLRRKSLTYKNK